MVVVAIGLPRSGTTLSAFRSACSRERRGFLGHLQFLSRRRNCTDPARVSLWHSFCASPQLQELVAVLNAALNVALAFGATRTAWAGTGTIKSKIKGGNSMQEFLLHLLTLSPLQTSMSTGSIPPMLPGEMPPAEVLSSFARFRESVADSVFFVTRNFPKVWTLRSTPRAWTAFRILLGVAGAALVVLPLSLWNAWAFAPVGLALFMLAVLLPPLRRDRPLRAVLLLRSRPRPTLPSK